MNWLSMRDFLTLEVKGTEKDKRYLFECRDAESPTGHSLSIKAEATHAAIVNGNVRFYRPDRMQAGTHTWVPAPGLARCPVLLHHDDDRDPVGRIHGARYQDLSYLYPDPAVRRLIFYDGVKGAKKLNLYESVDWVTDNLLALPKYKGLGYIELDLNIQDPDAIQKIQDGRYITVSVGFRTNAAICSICHSDWSTDEPCDHGLGKMVDGRRMFLICGDLSYRECSFVNFPADPMGQVKTGSDALKMLSDSVQTRVFFIGLDSSERESRRAALQISDTAFTDSLKLRADISLDEDDVMDLESILQEIASDTLVKERALELRAQLQAVEDQTSVKAALATLNAKIRVLGWAEEAPSKDLVQTKIDSLSAVLPTLSPEARVVYIRQLAERAKAAGVDFVPPELKTVADAEDPWKDFVAEGEDAVYFGRTEDEFYDELSAELESADAKLSGEARKNLKKSTFCGPGKSFPVPDCAHVTAARRLIGKAKVSEDVKKRILSCVAGKAKSMSCSAEEKKDRITDNPAFKTLTDHWVDGPDDGKKPFTHSAQMLQHIDDTHMVHEGLEEHERPHFREALYCLQNLWSASGSIDHIKQHIANRGETIIPAKDLEQLHEAIGRYELDLKEQKAEIDLLTQAQKAIITDSKQNIARIVVLSSMLLKEQGFEGLDTAQIQTEIDARSKRSLDSLKDSLDDLQKKLQGDPAPSGKKQDDVPVRQVSDKAQVADPPVTTEAPSQDSETEEPQVNANMLRALSPRERTRVMLRERSRRLKQSLGTN